ncbi:MAG: Uma2 family endonuclease [Acidobacteriota bacterium]|nr:Uma2 family endonuclease [Acidobacteriota bacterium]
MVEAGVFKGNARLELLEGSIFEKLSNNQRQSECETNLLTAFLNPVFYRRFNIAHQQPVRLNDFSEPQPDIALLHWREDFYYRAHLTPDDVLLLIEVADSTVEIDRSYKIPLYAKAGIVESWLVNLPEEQIEPFAMPANGVYQTNITFKRGDEAQSHTIKDFNINVSDIFG